MPHERRPSRRTDVYRTAGKPVYRGIPVVPGIAMGKVHLKFRHVHALYDQVLEEKEVPRELEILKEAVRLSKEQLLVAREKVGREIGELEAMIFDTHIAILEDRAFLGKVQSEIENPAQARRRRGLGHRRRLLPGHVHGSR